MNVQRQPQTEATTVRVPLYDRDADQKYSLEAVFLELDRFITRRHGRQASKQYRKGMEAIFKTIRPDHYEYVRSALESRINLEIQETIRDLHDVANTYTPPRR